MQTTALSSLHQVIVVCVGLLVAPVFLKTQRLFQVNRIGAQTFQKPSVQEVRR